MVESNITRRRVLQGAGAIGVASLGSTVISAQEEGGGQDGQSAAVRVAHASPDAPNVDVRLNSMGGGGAAGGENETGGEGDDAGGDQGGEDEGIEIGGTGFRDVSGYNEVDPGTYQVEIVPAEGGLIEGFIQDLFGGGDEDEETVLFDDQIDVEEGTTYTIVAFGEVAQGPIPAEGAEMEDGMAGNETDAGMDGNETDGAGTDDNETVGAGQNETDGVGQNETDGTAGGGAAAGGEQLVSELGFGEQETVELDPQGYTLEFREAGAAGMTEGAGEDTTGNETDGVGMDDNETDGAGMDDNETAGAGQNETDGVGADDDAGQAGGAERGFQVQVLEDDITDPGEETARLRVFHAVPDVDTISVSQISDEQTPGEGVGANDTDGIGGDEGAGQEEGDGAGQEEGDGAGGDAGQDEGAGGDAGQEEEGAGAGQEEEGAGAGQEDGGAGAGGQQEEGVEAASFSADANTAYSGFAVGYFDPEAAAGAGEDGAGADGDDWDGVMGDDNETGAGNETGGEGEEVAEDAEGEEFEFLTVEDAQGGERSDGGTGGLLDLAPPADD